MPAKRRVTVTITDGETKKRRDPPTDWLLVAFVVAVVWFIAAHLR